MDLPVNDKSYVVFDLDDTLYPERAFVESGFRRIDALLKAKAGRSIASEMMERFDRKENVLDWVLREFQLPADSKDWMLREYRTHIPDIAPGEGALDLLEDLRAEGVPVGLMTDGRSVTQRNKVRALGLERHLTDILISEEFGSEKPDPRNYSFFAEKYPGRSFVFIGDNMRKDFIVPARLGWTTICVKCSGWNIHPQDLLAEPRPDHIVHSLKDIRVVRSSAAAV